MDISDVTEIFLVNPGNLRAYCHGGRLCQRPSIDSRGKHLWVKPGNRTLHGTQVFYSSMLPLLDTKAITVIFANVEDILITNTVMHRSRPPLCEIRADIRARLSWALWRRGKKNAGFMSTKLVTSCGTTCQTWPYIWYDIYLLINIWDYLTIQTDILCQSRCRHQRSAVPAGKNPRISISFAGEEYGRYSGPKAKIWFAASSGRPGRS